MQNAHPRQPPLGNKSQNQGREMSPTRQPRCCIDCSWGPSDGLFLACFIHFRIHCIFWIPHTPLPVRNGRSNLKDAQNAIKNASPTQSGPHRAVWHGQGSPWQGHTMGTAHTALSCSSLCHGHAPSSPHSPSPLTMSVQVLGGLLHLVLLLHGSSWSRSV